MILGGLRIASIAKYCKIFRYNIQLDKIVKLHAWIILSFYTITLSHLTTILKCKESIQHDINGLHNAFNHLREPNETIFLNYQCNCFWTWMSMKDNICFLLNSIPLIFYARRKYESTSSYFKCFCIHCFIIIP